MIFGPGARFMAPPWESGGRRVGSGVAMSAEKSETGADHKPARPWRAVLIVAGYALLLGFCGYTILAILREGGGVAQVIHSLRTLGLPIVLTALACVAGTYAGMCLIEQMVLRDVGQRPPLYSTIAAPLIGNSVSIGVGFGAVSGAAIRYRIYGRYGMDAQTCVLMASGVTLVSLSGGAFLAALGLAFEPEAIAARVGVGADLLRAIGVAALAGAVALIVAAGGKRKGIKLLGRQITLPSAPAAFARLSAGALDWLLSATVLFVLLPQEAQTNWLAFAAFFAALHFVAMATGAPAGIGVFDAAMLGLNPTAASSSQLAAALVVYRALAFLLPLALGTIGLLFLEGRRRLRPHHALVVGGEPSRALLLGQSAMRRLVHFAGRRVGAFPVPASAGHAPAAHVGALLEMAEHSPRVGLRALTKGGPILIVAPHPDDEVLGCGGLLAACKEMGVEAHVVILTDGGLSHPGSLAWSSKRLAARRATEARKAAFVLGVGRGRLHLFGLRDGGLLFEKTATARAADTLVRLARRIKAKRIFVSWRHDPHPDHIAAAALAERVHRRLPHVDILEFPVWGRLLPKDAPIRDGPWTALRLDVTRWLPTKRRALLAYRTQTTALIADAPLTFRLQVDQLDALITPSEIFFSRKR